MSTTNDNDPFAPQPPRPPLDGAPGTPMMPPPPYGYGAPRQGGSSDKNYLGILALVFPFVGLGLVGIIMGHLGLSAVKKGSANNRGVALAGTIISWIATILPGILIALAIPLYSNQRDKAHEAEVKADLASLSVAVATHLIDHSEPPVVDIEGSHYVVGDQTETKADGVTDIDFVMMGDLSYCIAATYDGGKVLSIDEHSHFTEGGCDGVEDSALGALLDNPADEAVDTTQLAVGDCIANPQDQGTTDESGQDWVFGVTRVDCTVPHYGEVFAVVQLQAEEFVAEDVSAESVALCRDEFEAYVGVDYDNSRYYYLTYNPSTLGWKLGDRESICVMFDEGVDTVGSLRGIGQ